MFATETGGPVHYRNASSRGLDKAADRAGLNRDGSPRLSFHDLRYTAISRWIAAGLDVVEVQRQAGHANAAITLRLYAGEFQQAKRRDDLRAKLAATGLGAVLSQT